ncbi:hypothetical protein [Granulicoccus sp. GXG6511]|uniref:hypothetical protein n=1 Tax=Granulicoccus sp. GXG6511 TaxID=3381351 RepID=UPI003D7E077C
MSEPSPDPDRRGTPLPAPAPRSPWIDGTLAALVGIGYGLALFNSPTTWLLAVVLLVIAVVLYAILTFRFVRIGQQRPDPAAQRAHGIRLIALFAIAYLLTRIDPAPEWRLLHALAGGGLIGLGGFLVLRWEERARSRATLSE